MAAAGPDPGSGGAPVPVEAFEAHRPRLFGLAYRMLGSAHDAEDVLQDAWVRWSGSDRTEIESVAAWLTTVVTRLAITRLTSARARRETYPGPWLPEPVRSDELGPLDTVAQRESVSVALLVTLERLTPAERAVYVLHEAFGYRHAEVGAVIGVTEAHSRQLHHRARRHLDTSGALEPPADPHHWHDLVARFLRAANDGDLDTLEDLLAADVTAWADGGGRVHAARGPVHGAAAVARYLCGVARRQPPTGLHLVVAELNGGPAAVFLVGDEPVAVLTVVLAGDRIAAVRTVANPEKLARLTVSGVTSWPVTP